jgi:hypothetical protein
MKKQNLAFRDQIQFFRLLKRTSKPQRLGSLTVPMMSFLIIQDRNAARTGQIPRKWNADPSLMCPVISATKSYGCL